MKQDLRFHFDEHVHPAVAEGLKRRGIDVTRTQEVGLASATDENQLAFASSQNRVLVTHDADFLRLHNKGPNHCGIAYCHQQHRSVGDLVRGLVLLWEHCTAAEMINQVEFL